jgi:hypothetical protein
VTDKGWHIEIPAIDAQFSLGATLPVTFVVLVALVLLVWALFREIARGEGMLRKVSVELTAEQWADVVDAVQRLRERCPEPRYNGLDVEIQRQVDGTRRKGEAR